MSVLVYHVIEHTSWVHFPTRGPLLWFRTGWMAVDVFFVLSGFVVLLSAMAMTERMSMSQARKRFIWRRMARLLPLYLLTGAFVLVFVDSRLLHQAVFPQHLLAHLALVHNWWTDTHGSINGPNWSIAAEMQFYVLVALVLPVLKRLPPWRLLGLCMAVSWLTRSAVFLYAQHQGWETYPRFVYLTQVLPMLDLFGFGMVLAKVVRARPPKPDWCVAGRLLAAAATVQVVAQAVYWPHVDYWHNLFMTVFWRSLFGLSVVLLLAALVYMPAPRWTGSKPYRAAHYSGDISYGIYLWHLPVILLLKQMGIASPVLFLTCTLVATVLLASASWRWVEQPAMAAARGWLSRPR